MGRSRGGEACKGNSGDGNKTADAAGHVFLYLFPLFALIVVD